MGWLSKRSGSRRNIIVKPEYNDRFKYAQISEPCVVRPLPYFENGEIQPWRSGNGPRDFTDWLQVVPAGVFWGSMNKISMLDVCSDQLDRFPAPYNGVLQKSEDILWDNSRTKRFPEFVPMMMESGKTSRFQSTVLAAFMQTLVLHHDGKDLKSPTYAVFMIKSSAVKYMEAILNIPAAGVDAPPPEDYINGYKCGDLLNAETGPLWILKAEEVALTDAAKMRAKMNGGQGSKDIAKAFVIEFGNALPVGEDVVKGYVRPWSEILHYPTRSEAWGMVATAIGGDATAFCGRDEIDNLPPACRDKARYYASVIEGSSTSVAGIEVPKTETPASPSISNYKTTAVSPTTTQPSQATTGLAPDLSAYKPATTNNSQNELQRLMATKGVTAAPGMKKSE